MSHRLLSFPQGLLATAAAVFCIGSHAADAPALGTLGYTTLAVFGDSLSDSGNNAVFLGTGGAAPTSNSYVPSGAPYSSGTYSNGPVWVSSFAAGLGLAGAATPSLLGGGNYAYGGARTSTGALPPSATAQVASFLAGVTTLPSTGLYVIAIGGNDVRDVAAAVATGAAAPSSIGTAAAAYAASVGNMVDALQARGAQHIVVWDAPNVGRAPAALALGASFAGLATNVASSFNNELSTRLAGEAGVITFDVFGLIDIIAANPGAYGLTNVTDACGAVVNACSASLSTALFYDGIHPTAAGQSLIAAAMLATVTAVPEPSTLLMLALGLLLLTMAARFKRARAPVGESAAAAHRR